MKETLWLTRVGQMARKLGKKHQIRKTNVKIDNHKSNIQTIVMKNMFCVVCQ